MAEKSVGFLLTIGGLIIVLLGWAITEWVYAREYDPLNSLLEPLGTIFRYGGFIMLIAGIAWYARLYYDANKAGRQRGD
jgi:hypothetical protein